MQILHLSTLHPRTDPRIFTKEAVSLAERFPGNVAFLVADCMGDDLVQGVKIIDLGKPPKGRLNRFLFGSWHAFRKVREIKPNVLQFHDPELILMALTIKFSGIKVVYDVHEDLPRHILLKSWIPNLVKRPLSLLMEGLEKLAAFCFDAVVTVTPHIANRFPKTKTVLVANYAKGNSVPPIPASDSGKTTFIYVGNITRERGAVEMLEALELIRDLNPKLILAGKFNEPGLEETLKKMPAWDLVEFKGWVNSNEVDLLLQAADVGLSVLHSTPSYDVAYPTKVFEYMKFGLPVIGSRLPTMIEIVEGSQCGVLVEPANSLALARAMRSLVLNSTSRTEMSKNGRASFDRSYTWDSQAQKLFSLYDRLLEKP